MEGEDVEVPPPAVRVGRVDDVYGDRNIMCTCPPLESYASA